MTVALLILLKNLRVHALILAIGMSSTISDFTYLWRRPMLLLRSLLAMYSLLVAAGNLQPRGVPASRSWGEGGVAGHRCLGGRYAADAKAWHDPWQSIIRF